MPSFRVELSESAAVDYQGLELFERQQVFDLLESFGEGQNLDGDYVELSEPGKPLQVRIVSQTAVGFVVDRESRLVRVTVVSSADQ